MSRFFSSFVGINSAMNIVKIILLLGLLPLSFTSPLDEAIGRLLCHPDPTKTDEFPGIIRFPIPHDSDSIPLEFRALVGTEFARPDDHLYPTVRFCRVSILVINRTSPFWPFRNHPVDNEVHQFLGYPYISAEQLFDNSFPVIQVRVRPRVRSPDFPKLYCIIGMLTMSLFPAQSVQLESIDYHQVGGLKGWTMNLNPAEWAANEQFMVGDALMFVYDKNHYDVLEVDRSGYDSCDDKNLLMNVTKDTDSIFKLTEAKSYYFISSRDRCLQGLKMAINVNTLPPPPPPMPQTEYSSANTCTLNMILTSLLILWAGVFN
ncbi:hypothetical protein RHSIM_Rhsim03G0036900 [Rhododendron simsii]|uniref:Phytocyanin domain-containing protein n=1 Tax=Rhododendron simsii TaxID=118357 RepID=A0A834H2X4_RHOSS|nr:hypothetical protein RHSIM_Rhsim03G0036900 [Rhododendron simsii]